MERDAAGPGVRAAAWRCALSAVGGRPAFDVDLWPGGGRDQLSRDVCGFGGHGDRMRGVDQSPHADAAAGRDLFFGGRVAVAGAYRGGGSGDSVAAADEPDVS